MDTRSIQTKNFKNSVKTVRLPRCRSPGRSSIVPKGQKIALTAKIITTETSEIVGADKTSFAVDDTVKQLMSQQTFGSGAGATGGADSATSDSDTTKVAKTLGDMRVGLQSLQPINGGRQYLLTMSIANVSTKKSIWVALSPGRYGTVRDSNGYEFVMDTSGCAGIAAAAITRYMNVMSGVTLAPDRFNQATEIKPGETASATAKFYSEVNRTASSGDCSVQLEILESHDFNGSEGSCTAKSFTAKIAAE